MEKEIEPTGERDCRDLYCLKSTAICALNDKCISCSYKLCVDALSSLPQAPKLPQNIRPEACVRVRNGNDKSGAQLYSRLKVLAVGDGDLSFSVALARAKANITCTTLAESIDELVQRYPRTDVRAHYTELIQSRFCETIHFGVDATKLEKNLSLTQQRFDRIVFNFPCIDVKNGQDGQSPESNRIDNSALEANIHLITSFANSAKTLLKEFSSEIHIAHKSKPPFSWWNIPDCFQRQGYNYNGAIVFDRAAFPPYINRKARDRASFSASDALIYVFSLSHHIQAESAVMPTLPGSGKCSLRSDDAYSPYFLQQEEALNDGPITVDLDTVDSRDLLVAVFPKLLAAVRIAAVQQAIETVSNFILNKQEAKTEEW